MNASSQTPNGALPAGLLPVRPLPGAERAAYAAYDAVLPVPANTAAAASPDVPGRLAVDRPEPLFPQCFDCGTRTGALTQSPDRRRYPNGAPVLLCEEHAPSVTAVQASAALLDAELDRCIESGDSVTGDRLAQIQEDAGVLFHPERAEDIAAAAREQVRAEAAAELAQAAQDRQARDWFHDRQRAVGQLCEGRPLDHCLSVGEVLAALDGRTPTAAPLTITWDGQVTGPPGDTPRENTLIPCTTARGGSAALVVDDEQRLTLGGLLLASLHTMEACTEPGCGMSAEDLDASDPKAWGWILVDVAGTEIGARWWCNLLCAQAAMAAGGAELAAADQLAASDPDAPVPFVDTTAVVEDPIGGDR